MSIYSHVIIIFFDDLSATHRAVSSAVQRRRVTVTVCDLNSTVSVSGQVTHTKCGWVTRRRWYDDVKPRTWVCTVRRLVLRVSRWAYDPLTWHTIVWLISWHTFAVLSPVGPILSTIAYGS